jgi:hypothetical protein
MSIVVVGVESDGEGRPSGDLVSCGVSLFGSDVVFSCEFGVSDTSEFDASGWFDDDMLRICED